VRYCSNILCWSFDNLSRLACLWSRASLWTFTWYSSCFFVSIVYYYMPLILVYILSFLYISAVKCFCNAFRSASFPSIMVSSFLHYKSSSSIYWSFLSIKLFILSMSLLCLMLIFLISSLHSLFILLRSNSNPNLCFYFRVSIS